MSVSIAVPITYSSVILGTLQGAFEPLALDWTSIIGQLGSEACRTLKQLSGLLAHGEKTFVTLPASKCVSQSNKPPHIILHTPHIYTLASVPLGALISMLILLRTLSIFISSTPKRKKGLDPVEKKSILLPEEWKNNMYLYP